MSETKMNPVNYYASPGPMTDPEEYASLFAGLPAEVPALVEVVQGLLVHIFWAERCGLQLPQERRDREVNLRFVSKQLARIQELDAAPLTVARPLEKKLVGNCRDFSTLLCALLRNQSIPARARCGFGTYFLDSAYPYVDHWVCEYWKADEGRWVMVDAQLDAFQCQALGIQFDPLDMPPGQFVTGGQGWQMCRTGQADPREFGIFEWHGLWFVRGDLMRDFLALNKVEILPWDGGWGYLEHAEDLEAEMPEHLVTVMDRIAVLTLAGDEAFAEIRATYEGDSGFHVPADWFS
ncbi:MAG: transglutaminase domain-containing protein [Anaerolineae bacterium]|nr:transglutaminase domain-containing protein [Anaerolineae bacterium]